MTMRSICFVDGDHRSDLGKCIVALPGNASPEEFLIDYASALYELDDPFWTDQNIINRGISKATYRSFKQEIDSFNESLQRMQDNKESTKGRRREFNKKLFKDNRLFFELLLKHWLHNQDNKAEIDRFYSEFRAMFKKVAPYNEIDPNMWR